MKKSEVCVIEFHRLVSYFAFLPTEHIQGFMDGAERMTDLKKEELNDGL